MDMARIKADILTALNERLGGRDLECPGCHGITWTPPDLCLMPVIEFEPGPTMQVRQTRTVSPVALLCCDVCSYMMSFNVMKLGLWEKWQDESLIIPQGLGSNGMHLPTLNQFNHGRS